MILTALIPEDNTIYVPIPVWMFKEAGIMKLSKPYVSAEDGRLVITEGDPDEVETETGEETGEYDEDSECCKNCPYNCPHIGCVKEREGF